MLNYNKTGLHIFDSFRIDFTLPKWIQKLKQMNPDGQSSTVVSLSAPFFDEVTGDGMMPINLPLSGINIASNTLIVPSSASSSSSSSAGGQTVKVSIFDRIFGRKRLNREAAIRIQEAAIASNFETIENENKETLTVEEFFSSVKNSAEEIVLVQERLDSFVATINHLKSTGQVALFERVKREIEFHRAESQAYAIGLRKVITESNVVEFAKQSSKNIRLDYVANFVRTIPDKVVKEKIRADENMIFDNYVVMHYDPDNKGFELTEQEKQAKKDPILFGIIAGRINLYYIGDWIDEYCDLTFEKIVEKLGSAVINANDLTANITLSND